MAGLTFSPTRVLVTGGAGFLGSHLCERLLAGGHEVVSVDNYFTGVCGNLAGLSAIPRSRRCAETLFFDYHRQHRLPIKVARIFNTYGPRMHPNDGRVVSNFIIQALTGGDITVYGDGRQTRSFCYCSDLVDGLVRLMATDDEVTGPLNLGNPSEITIRDLAETVLELTGARARIIARPLPLDDPRQRCPDISKAQTLLGWQPKVPLADGLKETVAYFKHLLK